MVTIYECFPLLVSPFSLWGQILWLSQGFYSMGILPGPVYNLGCIHLADSLDQRLDHIFELNAFVSVMAMPI